MCIFQVFWFDMKIEGGKVELGMKKKEEVDEGVNEQVRKQLVSGEPVCRSEVQSEVSTERSSCK